VTGPLSAIVMQALCDELGADPSDQFDPVDQLPPAAFVQASPHVAAAAPCVPTTVKISAATPSAIADALLKREPIPSPFPRKLNHTSGAVLTPGEIIQADRFTNVTRAEWVDS
jgi:hypothetical protein